MNTESTLGISIVHNESEAKYFVPYVRALE